MVLTCCMCESELKRDVTCACPLLLTMAAIAPDVTRTSLAICTTTAIEAILILMLRLVRGQGRCVYVQLLTLNNKGLKQGG